MRDWIWQPVAVAAVASLVMFTNLGGTRLWDRDEPRNAGCAREMLLRGDWVTPVFDAELRTHKPVLLYWLIMSAYTVFGVNEFAARFWSAALAVGTTLCTWTIGRRLFGPSAGIWAGVVLATNVMFGVAGRAATPDSALIFFSTLAITIYVSATFRQQGKWEPRRWHDNSSSANDSESARTWFPRQWLPAALMYTAMGMAVLSKGPVGCVLPTAVLGLFLLIVRRRAVPAAGSCESAVTWESRLRATAAVFAPGHVLRTCWTMRPLTAIGAILVVAMPWYLWVGLRTDGEFLRGFFLEHNLGRAMQPMEGHAGSILFYPLAVLVGFFPWSVFAAPILIDAWGATRRDRAHRAGYVLLACWVGVYLSVFTLARTKLPSYVTPCYPALALGTGIFLDRWTRRALAGGVLWRRLAFATLICTGLGLLIGLPLAAARYLAGDVWLGLIGLIPLIGGAVCWILSERGLERHAVRGVAIVAILLLTCAFGLLLPRIDRQQQNGRLLAEIAKRPAVRVAALGTHEPSWVFYTGRPVVKLDASGQAKWTDAFAEIGGRWKRKPALGLSALADEPGGWLLITTEARLPSAKRQIPSEFEILASAPYFLRSGRLLLLGVPYRELAQPRLADPDDDRRVNR